MPPREKKMATQKIKAQHLDICDKCGSVMITRLIAEKNGSVKTTMRLARIKQCVVCRHWISLE